MWGARPSTQPTGQGRQVLSSCSCRPLLRSREARVSRGPNVTREGPGAGESPGKARHGANRRVEEAERAARGGSADLEMDLNVDGNSRAAVRSTTRETHNEGGTKRCQSILLSRQLQNGRSYVPNILPP